MHEALAIPPVAQWMIRNFNQSYLAGDLGTAMIIFQSKLKKITSKGRYKQTPVADVRTKWDNMLHDQQQHTSKSSFFLVSH